MNSLVNVQHTQSMQVTLFSKTPSHYFLVLFSILCVTDALQTAANLNGFKLKYFKTALENKFSENKFVKAKLNFCIVNFERRRLQQFHFKSGINFFHPRCNNIEVRTGLCTAVVGENKSLDLNTGL